MIKVPQGKEGICVEKKFLSNLVYRLHLWARYKPLLIFDKSRKQIFTIQS